MVLPLVAYLVNNSIVDAWIMLIMVVVGYLLRKLDFDPAPLVLGLVIAPTLELSLRQSLVMSSGNWTMFFSRPIAALLFAICGVLLVLSVLSWLSRKDWRERLAETEAAEKSPQASQRARLRAANRIVWAAAHGSSVRMRE